MSDPSYEKVNFALRPAKAVERKMIVETISRLRPFSTLEAYRYIGLGSPYFSDFSLVHRNLGITDMVCIEREKQDAARFEFNRPFSCIELIFGDSSQVLPTLEWEERPTVIWLDYDDSISDSILSDIHVICSSIAGGSFFLLTVRNRADDFGTSPNERVEQLSEAVGSGMPFHTSADLTNEAFPQLLWRIIDSQINQVVMERSAGLPDGLGFEYQQVLHFDYRDGARMLTLGGIVYQRDQRSLFAQCDFDSLVYTRPADESLRIRVPLLTFKELRALDEHLPGTTPSLPGVPQKEINAYSEHYRYFPRFVEAIES